MVNNDTRAQLVALDLSALTKDTRGQDWREVPEGAILTHEQALARFRTWTFDEQLRYMTALRETTQAADLCIIQDHDGAMRDARMLATHNAELRDRIDGLLRGGKISTTGENHVDIAGVYLTPEDLRLVRAEAAAEARVEGIREGRQQVADKLERLAGLQ